MADEGEGPSLIGAMSWQQFLDVANADTARAKRYRNPLSCLLIEVVHFKPADDTQGHAAEHLVLQHFVSICKATLRAPDYIGRICGGEFAIMLPETLLLQALGVAERILENLAASTSDVSRHHLAATTSIGVAEYDDQTWSVDQFLHAARAAMHDARQNGRNQAACYLDDLQLMSDAPFVN